MNYQSEKCERRSVIVSLFSKPEVIVLKESSDAKAYLARLEDLQTQVLEGSELSKRLAREIAVTKAGIIGEDAIMFELKNSGMDLVVLHDIFLEAPSGNTAQIDYLVITPGVYVFIECKNLFGNIEINSKGDFIRSMEYNGKWYKEGLYSPITQNERHMQVAKECREDGMNVLKRAAFDKGYFTYNKSLVVLANPKTVVNDKYAQKTVKSQVIRADQLIGKLKALSDGSPSKSSVKMMLETGELLLAMNKEERHDYFAKFAAWKEELDAAEKQQTVEKAADNVSKDQPASAETEQKLCPRCGKPLVLRTATKGYNTGTQFWGCSGFPTCRYVENVK